MKSTILLSFFFISFIGYGQTPQQIDSVNKSVVDWNRFVDSLETNTPLKQFREFIYKSVTAEFYDTGTYVNLWNWYAQQKYPIWLKQWNDKQKIKKP